MRCGVVWCDAAQAVLGAAPRGPGGSSPTPKPPPFALKNARPPPLPPPTRLSLSPPPPLPISHSQFPTPPRLGPWRPSAPRQGDQLISTSGVTYTRTEDYGGVNVRKGQELVQISALGQPFKAVSAAIGSHPASIPVRLTFQRCDSTVTPPP